MLVQKLGSLTSCEMAALEQNLMKRLYYIRDSLKDLRATIFNRHLAEKVKTNSSVIPIDRKTFYA